MKRTCDKGNITQLKVQLRLMELGYKVYSPVGDGYKADLVFDKDGRLFRAQVKTAFIDGAECFCAYSKIGRRSNKRVSGADKKARYTKEDVDCFITLDSESNLYIIPIEAVSVLQPRLHLFTDYIV